MAAQVGRRDHGWIHTPARDEYLRRSGKVVDTKERGDDCCVIPRSAEISAVASLSDDEVGPRAHRARAVGEVQRARWESASAKPGRANVDHIRSSAALLLHPAVGLRTFSGIFAVTWCR